MTGPMKAFFDIVRPIFGRMSTGQVSGIQYLVDATAGLPVEFRAYLLATVVVETGWTMQPIREYGRGKGRAYGRPGRNGGQVPYGRGYVQLTWDNNYERADRELGLGGALVKNYDAALVPEVAAKILIRGCQEGWFTGKSLSDYLPGDYVGARRVVNGQDRASEIARYARTFEKAFLTLRSGAETHESGLFAAIMAAINALFRAFGGRK